MSPLQLDLPLLTNLSGYGFELTVILLYDNRVTLLGKRLGLVSMIHVQKS